MKRKIRKMSTVSRVKTYKKGSRWVSAVVLTAGIGVLSLSGNSLTANADEIVSHSQSTANCVASASPTETTKSNYVTLKSSKTNSVASTANTSNSSNFNSAATSKILIKDDKEKLNIANPTHKNQINLENKEAASKTTANSDKSNAQTAVNNTNTEAEENSMTNNAIISDKLPAAIDNYHTPNYHIHNNQGWSNDVQTITQNADGTYNIYFLHSVDGATNPFGPNGQDWEHVTTKDWKTFQDNGIAINSHGTSNPNSWKSAWTGSIIVNTGNITGVPVGAQVTYFSGLSKNDSSQNIWGVWSDDNGQTFTHALNDGAPVLAWNQIDASGKNDQERDADVIYFDDHLLMYTAEGNQIGVYRSIDGIHWTKADQNGISKIQPETFFHGLNWKDNNIPVECPQIRLMKANDGTTKAVLFFGAKDPNGNPSQTTGTYYIVGHLDKNGLFVCDTNSKATRLDLGSDFYGANLSGNDDLEDAHDSLIGLGWVGNWSYTSQGVYNNQTAHQYPADKSQLENHLGSYSLPRKLQLVNDNDGSYRIKVSAENPLTPNNDRITATTLHPSNSNGQEENVGKDNDYGNIYTLIDHVNVPANQIYSLTFSTTDKSQYNGRIYININQGKDKIIFNFDPDNGMMEVNGYASELDNDMSGTTASSAYYDGTLGNGKGYLVNTGFIPQKGKTFTLHVFCDKTSIEIEFPNGVWYTVARYAVQNTQDFKVYTQDPRSVNEVSVNTDTLNVVAPSTSNANNNNNDNNSSTNKTSTPNTNAVKHNQSTNSSLAGDTTSIDINLSKEENAEPAINKTSIKKISTAKQEITSKAKTTNNVALDRITTSTTDKTTISKSKNTIPQAGEATNKMAIIAGIGVLLAAIGLGFTTLKRRH